MKKDLNVPIEIFIVTNVTHVIYVLIVNSLLFLDRHDLKKTLEEIKKEEPKKEEKKEDEVKKVEDLFEQLKKKGTLRK